MCVIRLAVLGARASSANKQELLLSAEKQCNIRALSITIASGKSECGRKNNWMNTTESCLSVCYYYNKSVSAVFQAGTTLTSA